MITYWLSLAALLGTAACSALFFVDEPVTTFFREFRARCSVRRAQARRLRGGRARFCLLARLSGPPKPVQGRVLHSRALRAARDHGHDLGPQPVDDLSWPRTPVAFALCARGVQSRVGDGGRVGDEVLRARRDRFGHVAVRHLPALRRYRDARDQHARRTPVRPRWHRHTGSGRTRVHRRRRRVQVRRRAVSHVGARRLSGRADPGDALHRFRTQDRGVRAGLAGARRRPGRRACELAGHVDRAVDPVARDRQRRRDRADESQAHACLFDDLARRVHPHGFHRGHGRRAQCSALLHGQLRHHGRRRFRHDPVAEPGGLRGRATRGFQGPERAQPVVRLRGRS